MESHSRIKSIKVSCIIINYNSSVFTIDAVKSILEKQSLDFGFEIIVVDNDSSDADFKKLDDSLSALEFSALKIVRSKVNLGFGGGNMLGVQHCTNPEYFAFINNDTLQTDENPLSKLYTFMQDHPNVGVCSPQMLCGERKFRVTIDHFSSLGREILRRPLLEKLWPKTYLNRKKTYRTPTKCQYVQGSFMFVNRAAFDEIGGFDTNLFLYYEESDISYRLLKQKNLTTYLVPSLNYIHFKGQSTPKSIAIKIEQKISLLYYIRKHHGFFQHKILLNHLILRYFFSSLVKSKNWKLFFVLLRGAPLSLSLKQQQKMS